MTTAVVPFVFQLLHPVHPDKGHAPKRTGNAIYICCVCQKFFIFPQIPTEKQKFYVFLPPWARSAPGASFFGTFGRDQCSSSPSSISRDEVSRSPTRTPPRPPLCNISTQSLQPLAVVKICLRQLGLAHTGVDGEAEVEVGGSDQLRKLVGQVVGHKRITAVLEELQDR